MKRALRWIRNALLGLVGVLAGALLVAYVLSERIVGRTYAVQGRAVAIPTDTASIAEGHRLAQIRGCDGCHELGLQGQVFVDNWVLAKVTAPDLTIAAREYSNTEMERVIRHGVRPNGRSVIIMPAEMFSQLNDADFGKILAYVRSVPPSNGEKRHVRLGPLARVMFALGKFSPAATLVPQANAVSAGFPKATDATARGAYLARTSCTECHGVDLRGGHNGPGGPDLRIAAGYSQAQFAHFMRTGEALGGRELALMSRVARSRFSNFTDDEIQALYAYLLERAKVPLQH